MKPRRGEYGRTRRHPLLKAVLLIAGLMVASAALAALPPPSAAQQQAAAEKKAKADAQAAKAKEQLAASMDAVAAHWRKRAAEQGWKAYPAVAVAVAAPAAPAAQASAPVQPAPGPGDPGIKSEKLGTAPPSEDVKRAPTGSVPRGVKPTVDKGTPDVKNK